ncbi:MAG: rhodanese-like domain-containing protein [Limisphaerales bacterium]
MNSAVRAVIVTHVLALCTAAFTACGPADEAATANPAPPETPKTAETPATPPPTEPTSTPATIVQNVDAAGARQLLDTRKDVVVLDVRTPEEFAGGHIAGARNLDFNAPEFRDQLSQLDRGTTYLVHCAAGGRSTRSLARFKDLGFKSVVHLDGGLNGWVQAGQAVEK